MKDHKSGFLSDQQNYEELSELIKKSYSTQSDISLYVEIDEITQWLKLDISKPLLITSPEFGGTKTLICELLRHCGRTNPNYLTISQFGSVSPYYSQLLYKITTQLRNQLDINQKVELNEQKLRQYFSYWLEVADQKIQRDYLGYTKEEKLKVIIVIEGVDKVVDGKGNYVRPSFWLPEVNLRNIRIIYTVRTGSSAIECLQPTISHKIQYLISQQKISQIKAKLQSQNPRLCKFSKQTHFGDLKLASKILQTHQKLSLQQQNLTFDQFLRKLITYLSNSIDTVQNICRMLACLVWSKKGITKNTLRRSFKFTSEAVDRFISAVKDFVIVSGDDAYLIINRKLRLYLIQIIKEKLGNQENIRREVHTLLAKALKKQTYTLNILEELIYHQICSFNFTELKELLSRVENFLVLYTPLTKHLLCMCWFQLEIQFQYDPVFEYNKAIERFLNHYYPSPQDTFKIIFQLSLFFKQYSEFQNSKTPHFRHPPIRGEIDLLKQISIFDELILMNMYQRSKMKNKQTVKQSLKPKKQSKDKQKPQQPQKPKQKQPSQSRLSITISSGQQKQLQQIQIKQVQKLNVRIKFHQQKFKNLYLKEMQPYLSQFYVIKKKNVTNHQNQLLDQDSDDSENQIDQSKVDVQRVKRGLLLKKFSDYCEEEYHRSSQNRSFYYYKQWIWMQFPWICQSLNHHYSELIEKCMKSPTQYMSIETESKLISEAIKIAKIAKQNKRQIYDNSKIANQPKQLSMRAPNHQSQSQKPKTPKHKPTPSQFKQKFNLSSLDSELQKSQKPKPQTVNQSSIFMTDLSVNQSYIQQKQNNDQQQPLKTSRLPNIMKVSKVVSSRVERNIDIVDTREYKLLVSKYDELRNQNQMLMQKIQTIQYNREILKGNNKDGLKDMMKHEIQEIKERKVKIMKSYKIQEALRTKLQMILKLCDFNKSHGSQSAHLHNFLNSLKTMCKIQEQNLQSVNQEAKKMLQEQKLSYKQLKQDKNNLVVKLRKQKNRLSKSNQAIPTCKDLQKHPQKSKYTVSKKKKVQISKQDTKRKNKYDRELQSVTNQLNSLTQIFHFIPGDACANQQIFDQFSQKSDKLNEIQWKLNELIDENNLKEKQLHQLEEQLKVSKGHREHQKQVKQRMLESAVGDQVHQMEERIKCLNKCFAMIDEAKGQGQQGQLGQHVVIVGK